jgi:regulator of RNase E activity RraA
MKIGFQILKRARQVDAATIDAFRGIPVANVGDVMFRLFSGGAPLRPMHAFGPNGAGLMAGPALTVRTRPGDNLMVHKAIDIAEPGDIIVVDAGGVLSQAIIGDLMLNHCIHRRLGGIVINGAIRDLDFISGQSFPVYAAGVTHRGPYKDGPGEINVPIALDGMVIEPGDLVLGDMDGMLAVPFAATETILAGARAKAAAEAKQLAEIKAGTQDRSWVDATLKRLGCFVE